MKQKFFFTWGSNSPNADHYLTIIADNSEAARQEMFNLYGNKWSMQYAEDNFKPEFFPAGNLKTIEI